MRRHLLLPLVAVQALALTTGCTKLTPNKSTNEYVWLTRYDVKTLDPAAIQDWTTGKVLSYLYPSIGELCEITSRDNKVFQLRIKGSQFSNGEEVKPEDIRQTIERNLYPETQSTVGNQFAAEIIGSQTFPNPKRDEHLEGIEIRPDRTIVLRLKNTDQAFAKKLMNRAFGVTNHHLVRRDAPITDYKPGYGAGNWTLESFAPGREWKLKSNTGQQLRFRFVADSATRRSLFDKGEADYAMFGAHEAGVVKGSPSLTKGGPTTLVYLQINPKTQPALTADVRRQMELFIKVKANFELVLNHMVSPADTFLDLSGTKGLPALDSGSMKPSISKENFEITYAEIGMQNPSVESVVNALHGSGFNIKGRAMPSGAMLEKNARGEIPILFTGWQPDFDGPLNTIPMLFHSKSSENHSGYHNPEVDLLIEKAQRGEDTDQNIQKAYQLIERDVPGIPLYIQRDLVLQKKEPPTP